MPMPDLDAIFRRYGDWWCRERGGKCDRMNVVQKGHEDRRLVLSDERIDFHGSVDTAMKPTAGARQVLTNGTNVEQSQTVELSKSRTSTFAWGLTEKPLENPKQVRSYSIIEPINGAGIAGLHDEAA